MYIYMNESLLNSKSRINSYQIYPTLERRLGTNVYTGSPRTCFLIFVELVLDPCLILLLKFNNI